MDLPSVLPILVGMVAILMSGSIINRPPDQNLKSALAEGALWGAAFFFSFSIAILLLDRI